MKTIIAAIVALFVLSLTLPAHADSDRDLIAKVVYAESCGEPLEGKVAVASVIVNRLTVKGYPHTIKKICFQKNAFESVSKKSKLWKKANSGEVNAEKFAECVKAADIALAGEGVKEITAFRTVGCKGGEKFFSKLTECFTIAHHRFYKVN